MLRKKNITLNGKKAEGKGVKRNLKFALECFKYTIDLFYKHEGSVSALESTEEFYHYHNLIHKYGTDIPVSEEPECVIHARKILAKHGKKRMINTLQKAAADGDNKAKEMSCFRVTNFWTIS